MYVTIDNPRVENPFQQRSSTRMRRLPITRLSAGAHLFFERDRVERIYQVVSGAVRLSRLLDDGRRQVIAFGFPGDIVGFPCDGKHHTDCEALTGAEVQPYRLSQIKRGGGDPELHDRFVAAAMHEIAAMQDHFMMLGRKSASEKLAAFLSVLASRLGNPVGGYTEFTLPMCRADIADFLGLTTETVSRTFSLLRKARLITFDGAQTVIVLRPDALKSLANGYRD